MKRAELSPRQEEAVKSNDMTYHDMTIEIAEATRTRAEDRRMIGRFKVRVFASPGKTKC